MSTPLFKTYDAETDSNFHVSVLQENLLRALETVKSAISAKPQLPVLANVAIIAENGHMQLFTTNLETFASFKIGAKIDKPFSITLPFNTLYDLVKIANPWRIDLSLNEKKQIVTISQDTWLVHLKGISIEEFPPVASGESDIIGLLNYADFKRIASLALKYLNHSDSRPALTQLHIVTGAKWHFMATDASNYFYASLPNNAEDKSVRQLAINGQALDKLIKSLAKSKPIEIEFSIFKDRELLSIGESMRDNPQIINYEKSVLDFPEFNRSHTARILDLDLLQNRLLKNRAKKANRSDFLRFGHIGLDLDGTEILESELIVKDKLGDENRFSVGIRIAGNIGPKMELLNDAPGVLAYTLAEITKITDYAEIDRVDSNGFKALQFRVKSGDLSLIFGFNRCEPGDLLSSKLAENEKLNPLDSGNLESINLADNSILISDQETGRITGIEFVKRGENHYSKIQFQLINGRKAYGPIIGKITGKDTLLSEFINIEKYNAKRANPLPQLPLFTLIQWRIIKRNFRHINDSLRIKEVRTGKLLAQRILNFVKESIEILPEAQNSEPDYDLFLNTEESADYPILWDEIGIEAQNNESPLAASAESPIEAQNSEPALPLPQSIEWLIKNSRILQDELGHDLADSGAFNNNIPFKMGQEILAWLAIVGEKHEINNNPWGNMSGQYSYSFADETRNFEIFLSLFNYGGKRWAVRFAYRPNNKARPTQWEKTYKEEKQAPEAENGDSPAIIPLDTKPEAQNNESLAPALVMNAKIVTPPSDFFRQNVNMNDLIRLHAETPHDTGAFHRAIDIARQLQAVGLWDAATPIRFMDAYMIHNAVMGVQGLPLSSLNLRLEHGEIVVSLPESPDNSPDSLQSPAEEENKEAPEIYPMTERHDSTIPPLASLAAGRWYYADIWRMGSGNRLALVYVRKIEGTRVYFHDCGTYDKHEAEKNRDMGEFRRYINEGHKKIAALWGAIPAQADSSILRRLIAEGKNSKQAPSPLPAPRKVGLKSVTFEWSESSAYEFPLSVDSWQAAAEVVRTIASKKRGFCDKTEILVEWLDGHTYNFRYDIVGDDSQDVAGRIWDYCGAKLGLYWELHFSPEMLAKDEDAQDLREFLQNYDLSGWQDSPQYVEVEAPAIPRPEDKAPEAIPDSPYPDRRHATKEERKALTAQRVEDKDTANQIRQELKTAFPSIKFSVRLSWATHSRALDVSWTDGPTVKEVDFILGKYKSDKRGEWGDESVQWLLNTGELVYYGIRFLSTSRSYSGDFLRKLAENALSEKGIQLDYEIVGDSLEASGIASDIWEIDGRSESFGYYVNRMAYKTSAIGYEGKKAESLASAAPAPSNEKPIKATRLASVWELSGDTKPHRDAIKAVGGKWDSARLVWVIQEDYPRILEALTEFGDLILAQERLFNEDLRGSGFSDHWRVFGETFAVKNTLKAAGFYWNGYEWILNKPELPASVRALFAPKHGGDEPKEKTEVHTEIVESQANEWGSWGGTSLPPALAPEQAIELNNSGEGLKIAAKLRQAAAGLESKIADKFKDRLTNTRKRANQDEQARMDGRGLQQRQNILNVLANMHEAGTIPPHLAKIQSKADLESALFGDYLRRVYQAELGYLREYQPTANYSKEESNLLDKIASRLQGNREGYGYFYMEELPILRSMEKKAVKAGAKWMYTHEELERKVRLGITEANYIAIQEELKRYKDPNGQILAGEKAESIRKMQQDAARANVPGYFPTPPDVISKMLEWLECTIENPSILEPSAGAGHLAEALRESFPKAKIECIEPNVSLSHLLMKKDFYPIADNFLEYEGKHDLIVMNPPFEDLQDIDHVLHAFDCLSDGGRIVAIMSESPFFRQDKKAVAFRQWLDEVGGYSEKLPDGAFLKSERPTGVATRIVILDKPSTNHTPKDKTQEPIYKEETSPEAENFEVESEEERGDYWALITWEEGKLELHSRYTLDKDVFKALMGEGFKYVQGETIYYAPYTPWRYKYLMDNFGITALEDDFEKHLRERAENRSDRFEGFSDNAAKRGASHLDTANRISERFYMGQPILVGHHSEGKARRDQAKMWDKTRQGIDEQDRASYWSNRADGAINRANRRETLRAVVNRIDRLEADLRKAERELAKSPEGKNWHWESWRWFYTNRLEFERALLAAMPQEKKPDEALKIEKGGLVWHRGDWCLIEGIGSKNVVIHPYACTIKVKLATITPNRYKSPQALKDLIAENRVYTGRRGVYILEQSREGLDVKTIEQMIYDKKAELLPNGEYRLL